MTELVMVGLDHHVAPVQVRERLALSPERIMRMLRAIAGLEPLDGIQPFLGEGDEAAILSTCNRTEVYFYSAQPETIEGELRHFLTEQAQMTLEALDKLLYRQAGEAAACHLMYVAAGLDSLLTGENEILGQVKEAGELAHQAQTSGPVLAALFRAAARAGKRVRTETEIGRAGLCTATVVVELAQERLGALEERTALLIGAGKISSTAAHALVRAGLRCILVANRTFERAQRLAANLGQTNARAVHFDALPASLVEADIVICSTGAPHFILHKEQVEMALAARNRRPLLVVDLAVPRDVHPDVADLAGVILVSLDELGELVARRHPLAATARCAAEEITQHELQAFLTWMGERKTVPLIRALQEKAQAICQAQVEITSRRLGELSPQQQRAVEMMGKAIVSRLLHAPIEYLHDCSGEGPPDEMEETFRKIFDLS